jgi:hypothetical protein
MSATGQGGVTLIAGQNHGQLSPVTIDGGNQLVFSHDVGRYAFSVLVTDGGANRGQLLTGADNILILQPDVNTVIVQNTGVADASVYISIRWEEPSSELDLVLAGAAPGSVSDPRIVIETPPG